ncbi:MAG: prolyl oligopeptidase family serine peptidase [Chitinivibrionales bacterium]|nr:prolyl oligopeptidase family serine peptidase [Chitinivibrionales bacterium]
MPVQIRPVLFSFVASGLISILNRYQTYLQICKGLPMRMLYCFISLLLLVSGTFGGSEKIEKLSSTALNMEAQYTVFLPDNYDVQVSAGHRYPVLYLLHCAGCDDQLWTSSSYGPMVDHFIDSVDYLMVAPNDGSTTVGRSYSWWLDSPIKSDYQYSTFLVSELKPHIDSLYKTFPDRKNTGLMGHSMGGFGAFHNIIEHPDVYAVAFSVKGGFDLRYPHNPDWASDFGLNQVLGTEPSHQSNWQAVNVVAHACSLKGEDVSIGFYAGKDDAWFYEENAQLHSDLQSCGIAHVYWETPENHFSVPLDQTRKILKFFDSTFVRNNARVKKKPIASSFFTLNGNSSGQSSISLYTLRGKRLPPRKTASASRIEFAKGEHSNHLRVRIVMR